MSGGTATGYRLGGLEFELWQGEEIFLFFKRQDRLWGPPSLLFNGYLDCFPGVKLPRREDNHLTSFRLILSEAVILLPICLHGVDRDKFIFTL